MNLQKMIYSQKKLDSHIRDEKGLENTNTVADLYVALQVELGEFANEGRWFKFWSEDQEPRTEFICELCEGSEEIAVETSSGTPDLGFDVFEIDASCPLCEDVDDNKNPLLEEFADGVHLFLSIAIQKNWEDALFIYGEQLDSNDWNGNLTGYYMEMIYFLNCSYIRKYSTEQDENFKGVYGFPANQFDFRMAWICFLNIGINGFGLDLEKIEKAYYEKNEINHERQVNGY